jgi:hypothetical protein
LLQFSIGLEFSVSFDVVSSFLNLLFNQLQIQLLFLFWFQLEFDYYFHLNWQFNLNTNHYFWFLDIQLRLQSLSDFNSYFYNPTFMSTIYLSFATTFSQWTWIPAIILAFVVEFLIVLKF